MSRLRSLVCMFLVDPDQYWLATRRPLGRWGWYRLRPENCVNPQELQKVCHHGSADSPQMASNGSANPSKTASKGSAGPSKTVPSMDDASSLRVMSSKVRVEGVLVDVRRFINPRCSASSGRPQVPLKLKDKAADRQKRQRRT